MKPMTAHRYSRLSEASLKRFRRITLAAKRELHRINLSCLKRHLELRQATHLSSIDKRLLRDVINQEQMEANREYEDILERTWNRHVTIEQAARKRLEEK